MADPRRVGAVLEQYRRRLALPAVGRAPERVVEVPLRGRRVEPLRDAPAEPEGGRLPQVRVRAALQQAPRGRPLAERDGVGERGPAGDHRAAGLDVRTRVEERVERLDVVVAGRPVQRRLGVGAREAGTGVGARRDEEPDLGRRLGHVPGPVGEDVEQRPRLALAPDPSGCQPRVLAQQRRERGGRLRAQGRRDADGELVVGSEQHRPPVSRYALLSSPPSTTRSVPVVLAARGEAR